MKNIDKDTPDISVVVLCYKAGKPIVDFISEVKKYLENRGLSYELVLVANYDKGEDLKDETPAIVNALALKDHHLLVVSKVKAGMYGWDVRSGLEIASGRTVAYIDGDGQMPAVDVVRVYDELTKNRSDMAQTFRVKRHDSLRRIFISRVYNAFLKILYPEISIHDVNSKPKIFTRESINQLDLKSDDWFIDAEIVIKATRFKFSVLQIPTVFLKNRNRSSFVNLGTIFEFLRNLIRYRFSRKSSSR